MCLSLEAEAEASIEYCCDLEIWGVVQGHCKMVPIDTSYTTLYWSQWSAIALVPFMSNLTFKISWTSLKSTLEVT